MVIISFAAVQMTFQSQVVGEGEGELPFENGPGAHRHP